MTEPRDPASDATEPTRAPDVDDDARGSVAEGADAARAEAEAMAAAADELGAEDDPMSGNVAEWEDSCDASTGATDTCLARGGSFASQAAGSWTSEE